MACSLRLLELRALSFEPVGNGLHTRRVAAVRHEALAGSPDPCTALHCPLLRIVLVFIKLVIVLSVVVRHVHLFLGLGASARICVYFRQEVAADNLLP